MSVGGLCFVGLLSISDLSSRHSSPAVLPADAVALVREAAGAFFAARSDEDLIATVELVAQLRAVAAAVEAGAVAEADHATSARTRLHDGSTGDWLTHLGGLGKGRGRRVVARAHALTGPLTATRVAAAGRVSPEQAGVWDASDLARTGRHLVHVVDPDTTDRRLERQLAREERASHLDRYLALTFDGAGGVRLKGRGSAEDGAHLKAALLPLTAPAPAPASATALDDSTTSTGSWCTSRGRRGIRGRRVPGCGTPSSAGSPDS